MSVEVETVGEDKVGVGWLVISYLVNMDGVSTAQWVDDRLPWLQKSGIDCYLLSSPCSLPFKGLFHIRVPSLSPEELKYLLSGFGRYPIQGVWPKTHRS